MPSKGLAAVESLAKVGGVKAQIELFWRHVLQATDVRGLLSQALRARLQTPQVRFVPFLLGLRRV